MFWEEANYDEFLEIIKRIQKAGFLEENFTYKDPTDNETYPLTIFNKILRRSTTLGQSAEPARFKQTPEKNSKGLTNHIEISDHKRWVDSFFHEYGKIVWKHKQDMKSLAGTNLLEELKEDSLSEIENYLLKKGYGSKAIKATLEILGNDLDKRLKAHTETPDYKYFIYSETHPLNHPWIARENEAIHDIKELYKKYTPLSERQIRINMALVFKAVVFRPHREKDSLENIQDTIKKRFDKLKKSPFLSLK